MAMQLSAANSFVVFSEQENVNKVLAEAGNPDANLWADKVEECFKRDAQLCNYYNKVMANGKWDGMMTQKHIGYSSWNDDWLST